MSIRLQTWAPFEIQIALNGREWLRRLLDKNDIQYILEGNKFLHIDDYERAQQLLNSQLEVKWEPLLIRFLPQVFPAMRTLLGDTISYTRTLWQSEWTRDCIFTDPKALNTHMTHFLHHAFMTGTSDRVLRYMRKPVRENGQPYPSSNPELMTRMKFWYDGARIRPVRYRRRAGAKARTLRIFSP